MDLETLQSKWIDIHKFKDNKGYMALRITPDCIPDLFIATDSDGNRCLLLYLPTGTDINLKPLDKDKLMLSYISDKNVIVINLKDSNYVDLFNDLILSLYSKLFELHDSNKAANELIRTYYKWSDFFEDCFSNKLSIDQVIGLIGELIVLNSFISAINDETINAALESWQGPYGTSNDFVFDSMNFEVKTRTKSKPFVKISSEYQLEVEFDKGLELVIVTVIQDLANGRSLHDLVEQVIDEIRINNGDVTIFYKALSQVGLTTENVKEYNNYRYDTVSVKHYDCTLNDFPKLSKSDIYDEISSLSYKLRVTKLDQFLIKEKK